jgi:hypothetical protein
MGLGPRFFDFSSQASPLCILHFWVWSFVGFAYRGKDIVFRFIIEY